MRRKHLTIFIYLCLFLGVVYGVVNYINAKNEPDPYVGAYNSYDVNEPDLQIQKNEDGTYLIQIGIFRLTFLQECTGILVEDKIVFSTTEWGEDKEITGTITVDDEDIATVTLEAAWSDWWFKNINVYKYYKVSDTPDIYELQY